MEVHLVRADLIVVGTLSAELARVAADYERRLSRYVKLNVHELRAEPTQRGESVVLRSERERIEAALTKVLRAGGGEQSLICALDSRGTQPTTEQLAQRWLAAPQLVVIIGGTMGLAPELLERARYQVSFGRITLPHQMARVVATEQLYRSFRIARGEPYHF